MFSHKTPKFFHQHRLGHDLQSRKDNKAHVYHVPGPLFGASDSQGFPGSFPAPSRFKSWAPPARNSKEPKEQLHPEDFLGATLQEETLIIGFQILGDQGLGVLGRPCRGLWGRGQAVQRLLLVLLGFVVEQHPHGDQDSAHG